MISKMIDGIVRQIRQSYGEEKYEIYTEAVKQSLKEPCFSVLCLNPSLRRKLGPRFLKTVPFMTGQMVDGVLQFQVTYETFVMEKQEDKDKFESYEIRTGVGGLTDGSKE